MPTAAERHRLLLLDDDVVFLRLLAGNLRDAGYDVAEAADSHRALAVLATATRKFDACVFDWDMPGMDGMALLRRLRADGVGVPVLFLTGHASPMFEEAALAAGAIDFIDKSRGPAIVLHRLALALSRGAPPAPAGEIAVGALLLRATSRRALWRGREVPLSRGEFDMVEVLVRNAGTDVSYRALYDALRGEGFLAGPGEEGYRTNVRAMIKRIRRKFAELDPAFDALGTYAGFGYRWRGDGR